MLGQGQVRFRVGVRVRVRFMHAGSGLRSYSLARGEVSARWGVGGSIRDCTGAKQTTHWLWMWLMIIIQSLYYFISSVGSC